VLTKPPDLSDQEDWNNTYGSGVRQVDFVGEDIFMGDLSDGSPNSGSTTTSTPGSSAPKPG